MSGTADLPLRYRTPDAWARAALAHPLALLNDHAHLEKKAAGNALELLNRWPALFEEALVEKLVARLGVTPDRDRDRVLVSAMLGALRARVAGIDRFFFDWRGGRVPDDPVYAHPAFDALRRALDVRQRPLAHGYWDDAAPCSMLIDEVEAIWSAIDERDDWAPLYTKVARIRDMGEALS